MYIAVNSNGLIVAMSDTPIFMANTETFNVDIPHEHPILDDLGGWHYTDSVLHNDEAYLLEELRASKMIEFNMRCQETIEAGFDYEYEGTVYHFSLDTQAQQNFSDSYQLLKDRTIQDVAWTVKVNGEYSRLVIDFDMMQEISHLIFLHKTNNIAKFRDILMPIVNDATTQEELGEIVW